MGPASRFGFYASEFLRNFEAAFTGFVLLMPYNVSFGINPPTLTLLEGQQPLAIYFSRFNLVPNGRDCYSKLILALKNAGCLSSCIFGSLNYDYLFEQAVSHLLHGIGYSCRTSQADQIRMAKIHGSCNFVTPVLTQMDRGMLSGPNVPYEKGFDIFSPVGLETPLREALSSQTRPRLPVMSQISLGKGHWLAPAKIQEYRNAWREQARAAGSWRLSASLTTRTIPTFWKRYESYLSRYTISATTSTRQIGKT